MEGIRTGAGIGRWTRNGSTRVVWTSNGRAPVVLSEELLSFLSCQSIDVVGG